MTPEDLSGITRRQWRESYYSQTPLPVSSPAVPPRTAPTPVVPAAPRVPAAAPEWDVSQDWIPDPSLITTPEPPVEQWIPEPVVEQYPEDPTAMPWEEAVIPVADAPMDAPAPVVAPALPSAPAPAPETVELDDPLPEVPRALEGVNRLFGRLAKRRHDEPLDDVVTDDEPLEHIEPVVSEAEARRQERQSQAEAKRQLRADKKTAAAEARAAKASAVVEARAAKAAAAVQAREDKAAAKAQQVAKRAEAKAANRTAEQVARDEEREQAATEKVAAKLAALQGKDAARAEAQAKKDAAGAEKKAAADARKKARLDAQIAKVETVARRKQEATDAIVAKKAAAIEAKDARARVRREAKAAKLTDAQKLKADTAAERKRRALKAKEEKEHRKTVFREATEEVQVEAADRKSRIARERKARKEWQRKQKRREQVKANGGKEGFWQGTNKPKPIEIANSIRSLAIILETSTGEIEPLRIMAEEFAGNRIGDAFDRIYERMVKDSATMVEAFAPERDLFPPVVHNMLRMGAATAKPAPALRTAVELLDSGNNNKRKMRNALIEPVTVAVISMAMLFATAYFVVPTFLDMYESLDMEVGAITQFVIVFSDISVWAIAILAILAVATAVWWFAWARSSLRIRVAIDRWMLHAPLIGKAEQTDTAFQMFNILGSYLNVGSSEREALIDTSAAIENRAVKRHLRATANGLAAGTKTFAQFLDDPMFPRLARNILSVGQSTGRTSQVMQDLRTIYENESEVEGKQAVEKVVGLVAGISSLLFVLTAFISSVPPLEIFGATLGYSG